MCGQVPKLPYIAFSYDVSHYTVTIFCLCPSHPKTALAPFVLTVVEGSFLEVLAYMAIQTLQREYEPSFCMLIASVLPSGTGNGIGNIRVTFQTVITQRKVISREGVKSALGF